MKPHRISLLALTFFFLVACSSVSQPSEDGRSTSAQPTMNSTATSLASAIPSSTPTEAATPLPDFGRFSIDVRTFPSPDRSSTASILTAFPRSAGEYYVRLEAHENHVVIDAWRQWGLGYAIPTVLGWSADSKTLYIATSTIPDGCAPFDLMSDVRSISIPYGSPKPVPLEVTGPLSLSSDGLMVANVQEGALRLYSLDGGEIAQMDLSLDESDRAGSIVWAPSSKKLVFAIQHNACDGQVLSEILLATVPQLEVRPVAEFAGKRVWAGRWIGERMLLIREQFGEESILDTQTGNMFGPK